MDFRKVKKSDYATICSFLKNSGMSICDYSCGAFIIWHDFDDVKFAVDNGFLYLYHHSSTPPTFAVPLGDGDFEGAVRKLEPFAQDGHLYLDHVPVEKAVQLQHIYGDRMTYRFNRDNADYIYHAQSMVTFAGKKLSAMRNHLNRFQKENPTYGFVPMSEDNLDRVRAFFTTINAKRDLSSPAAQAEAKGIFNLLDHLHLMDWRGGFIELDGNIIAASIGEVVGNSLIIHIEKADTSYSGCYQVMVNEFAKAFVTDDIKWINREDDIGLEGLRKSKLAYRPYQLLDKAVVDITLPM